MVDTQEVKKEKEEKVSFSPSNAKSRLIIENVDTIKSNLRAMSVEKEIVGYALTRLYEAEVEGKIGQKKQESFTKDY